MGKTKLYLVDGGKLVPGTIAVPNKTRDGWHNVSTENGIVEVDDEHVADLASQIANPSHPLTDKRPS